MPSDTITLAGSDVSIPRLGVGTWAWGDSSTWGMGSYDTDLTRDSIREAWDASIDAGVTLFDTAEVYGGGESERIIGSLLAADPVRAASAVVWPPSSCRRRGSSTSGRRCCASLRASLARLGVDSVALYQIHGPISLRSHAALADALAAAHGEGLVRAVGVSNYSVKETRSIAAALEKPRTPPGHQPDRVLVAPAFARDVRAPGRLCRPRRRAPGLLAHRAGPAHRQVLGRPPAARQAELLQPPDGDRRRRRRRAPGHRRGPRRKAPQPGRPQLGHRQRGRAHPGGEEPASRQRRTPGPSGGSSMATRSPGSTGPPSPGIRSWEAGCGSTAESPVGRAAGSAFRDRSGTPAPGDAPRSGWGTRPTTGGADAPAGPRSPR